MKTVETKTEDLVAVSESKLLALVAAKFEGVVLFPEQIEESRKFLASISASVI